MSNGKCVLIYTKIDYTKTGIEAHGKKFRHQIHVHFDERFVD